MMTSFLFLSFSETPNIHRSIGLCISVPSPLSRPLLHTVSTYLIIVLYTFLFRCFGIFASHETPARIFQLCQAAFILLLTSCLQPPLSFITDPMSECSGLF